MSCDNVSYLQFITYQSQKMSLATVHILSTENGIETTGNKMLGVNYLLTISGSWEMNLQTI